MYSIIDVSKLGLSAQEESLEEITHIAQDKCISENHSLYIIKLIARVDPHVSTTMTTME